MFRKTALILLVLATVAKTYGQAISRDESEQRAQALLKQMNLDEKVGQLNQSAGIQMPMLGSEKPDTLIEQGRVGSILWLTNVKEINRLQHIAVEKSRLHIPILFAFDVIHGYRTVFPVPLAMASSWDPGVEEQAQHFAAQDARAAGIEWTFTPMVDIARDARWGRIVEGAGEDPYLGKAMAAAQVRGFQGDQLGPDSVLVCVKHFAGYGAADGGRDYDSSYIPEELFRNVYLAPFYAAAKAGAGSFMSAYMDLNDVPASGNKWLLTDILRNEWGFKGFLVSDAFAVGSLQVHGYAKDPSDAAYKAITAGLNMDMASQTYTKNLAQLVKDGKVTEAQIDAMVLPILAAKYQLGLFDHPYADESKVEATLNRPEGLTLERKLAARSMVLLKNDKQTLPLKTSIKKIALIGPLGDSTHDIEGGWTVEGLFGNGSKSHPVTLLAGLKNKLPNAQISTVSGPELSRVFPGLLDQLAGKKVLPPPTPQETADWIAKVKAAASDADLVVAAMGEIASMSSEASSRATLDLPGIQQQMLEAAVATGKPVVLVLLAGRPLDIRWPAEHVPAILEAWYPGTEGGNAIADVLFGDVNPGGKLPVSWPRVAGAEPLYYNHNLTHEPEDRPQFTSRYWDIQSKPLYPFGYGLSYTTFKFANLKLSQASIGTDGSTQVSVEVTNTGSVAGDAVGQVYIHQRWGSASRPVRQLKGFQRVALQPGETKTLTFPLGKDELEFWSPQTKNWVVEPSTFDVWAGEDSTAPLHAELTVTQ
ncbi:beta-glucosidase BglX [Occallatibacter riparius]|uniref:Beta-glucosidase BglX n=1 Tax=Occallatibacter riparius TaxID=1002689 RepID=A0A9J7BH58_9BACT|nr:beta-glucosidase BglX [Occallatibacter riparius]UWZ82071.1 beta-glucosidase BglX [Occallatibacter riparius]